jgi:hypothetical protein
MNMPSIAGYVLFTVLVLGIAFAIILMTSGDMHNNLENIFGFMKVIK